MESITTLASLLQKKRLQRCTTNQHGSFMVNSQEPTSDDHTPREEMRRELLIEVNKALSERLYALAEAEEALPIPTHEIGGEG